MSIQYKIIALDKARGQIVVRFFNEDIPEGLTNAIDFMVQGDKVIVPSGKELDAYIMGFAPHGEFARVAAAKSATPPDYSHIEAMLEPDAVVADAPAVEIDPTVVVL